MLQPKLEKSYRLGGIDFDHDYRVRIPFTYGNMTDGEITKWNEACARAIEMFGLPGEKYTCRMTASAIEFWFLDGKDAMVFELTCG